MEGLKPFKSLSLEGNLEQNWKTWKQELTLYMQATESSGKSDTVKSSILLHCIGSKSREIYNTFTFAEQGDNMKFDKIIEKFDGYFTPKKNLTLLRFKFFTARQQDGESFDEFLTRLRKLSKDCDFASLQDSLLRDMIIIGILDKRLQERLLRESDITLENTIKHCQASEVTKKHVKILRHQAAPASVAKMSTKKSEHLNLMQKKA